MPGEREFWLAFNLVAGVGPVRMRRLLEQFGSLSAAWHASSAELAKAGLDSRALRNFNEARRRIDPAAELARLDRLGISLLTWNDIDYPALLGQLRAVDQAPPVLYLRGSLSPADDFSIAIVGTRSASAYGRQVTHHLVGEMAAAGLTIISGLALGIDAEAHGAALEAGGRTIAVLPCGLDDVYPPEHRSLAARIIRQGALLSVFPPGTPAEKKNFAPRNQVISGLARGVLVTEAGSESGALLTARAAMEQGREVFAVPGNITLRSSSGANRLIQEGAHAALSAEDVLEVLSPGPIAPVVEARRTLPDTDPDERAVLEALSADPLHIDEITRACGLPVARVTSALTLLELKGLVRQVGVMTYVRL